MQTLIKSFIEGGFFMWPILAVGLAVMAIVAERTVALYKNYKTAPSELRYRVMSFIALNQYTEAKSYIELSAANTPVGRIVTSGLTVRHAGGGDEEVQARMDEALSHEISTLDRRTGFLAVYGNVATLLGLLGTVTGMIVSFQGVTNANPSERALLLGRGISEALNATAFGLAVAIPALVAYAIFQNRTERLVTQMTEEASKIFHDFLFHTDSRQAIKGEGKVNSSRNMNDEMIQRGN
jgi:biopolymer transport protein ExbB